MPSNHEDVLDGLMDGLSIEDAAERFGVPEAEVREILKRETARVYDGEAMRAEWVLTARRLRRMELTFDKKAIDDLDCAAAVVAIKASERRASLTGANAPPNRLVTVMHAAPLQERPTSTQRIAAVMERLVAEGQAKGNGEAEPH
jgi:hypothetical protein